MAKKNKKSGQPSMPEIIYAEASVQSIGGKSLFDTSSVITSDTVDNYSSDSQLVSSAIDKLRTEGFEVLSVGETTITISGSQSVYEKALKTKIVAEERPAIKQLGKEETATFLECPDTDVPGLIETNNTIFADLIEGIALNEPVYFFQNAFAPTKEYWHLDVPAGISLGMNADRAHRIGYNGKGIKVVMVDSGWYRHPYFVQRGYRSASVVLGPAAANPTHDESGHGTGESANIFSVAPDVNFQMVKINFVNSVGAFNEAVALNPDIISCSWGSSRRDPPLSASNQVLAAAISSAVRRGIVVVFSAGNGHWGFPGQHPDVISAGGVFMEDDGSTRASDYASGFASRIYAGRNVPDVSGLVGMRPKALYIMLPVEPGDGIDSLPWNHPSRRGLQGGVHPNGDETGANDGWAAFSGTSAAAPQIAGICALIKQACRWLSPSQVRGILKRTARDVTVGNCSPGTGANPATSGPDLATGHGLADAYRATIIARFRCILRPPVFPRIPPIVVQPPLPPHIPRPIPIPRPQPDPVPPFTQGDITEDEYLAFEAMILGEDLPD